MPRFIDTGRHIVNLDHVLAIHRHRRKLEDDTGRQFVKIDVMLEMVHGEHYEIDEDLTVEHLTEDLVPAAAGYFALKLWNPGTADECFERAPVVAWRISEGFVSSAVALGYDGDASTIACPDGRVIEICSAEYESVDDWVESERQSATERRASNQ